MLETLWCWWSVYLNAKSIGTVINENRGPRCCFPIDLVLVRSTGGMKKNSFILYVANFSPTSHAIDSAVFLFFYRYKFRPITIFYTTLLRRYLRTSSLRIGYIYTGDTLLVCVPRRYMFARRVYICIPSPQSFHRGSLHMRYKLRPNNRCRSVLYLRHFVPHRTYI